MADTITLNFTPIGGAASTSILPVLLEKGLTRAEKYSMYPPIVNQALDGETKTQFKAFIRNCDLRTDSLTAQQLKDWLNWCLDNDRTIDYTIDGVTETGISLIPDTEQEVVWYDDFKETPYLEVNMNEGVARTSFP